MTYLVAVVSCSPWQQQGCIVVASTVTIDILLIYIALKNLHAKHELDFL